MIQIRPEAIEHVRATYIEGVAEYLLTSDGIRPVYDPRRPALSGVWRSLLEDLVSLGFMRRSQRGRYWWQRP